MFLPVVSVRVVVVGLIAYAQHPRLPFRSH